MGASAAALGALGAEVSSLMGLGDHRAAPRGEQPGKCGFGEAQPTSGVLHVGHSTHVIRLGGVCVLTDPWFHDPAFGALVHDQALGCALEQLPPCGAIAVSHGHPDHCDSKALDQWQTKRSTVLLVGDPGLVPRFKRLGFSQVEHLALWEALKLDALEVHAVPALHDVPEQGFVFTATQGSIYFAGDTAWHGEWATVRERFHPRLALLPCDGGKLRGSNLHTLTPAQAALAAAQLGVSAVAPSHADALFTDWIAEHVLSAHVDDAKDHLRDDLARVSPQIRFNALRVGSWLTLD